MQLPEQTLDRALQSERGVKITFTTAKQAEQYRFQCYAFIRKERRRNGAELGEETCEYDVLTLTLEGKSMYVRFRADEAAIEEL